MRKTCKIKTKVKFFDKTLWHNYLAVVGVIAMLVTLISFFTTADSINISKPILGGGFAILLALIFLGMWWWANIANHANLQINGTRVSVCIGDILGPLSEDPANRAGEINVIGVNDYYDIIVDNRIVSSSSLHGQYINRIVAGGKLESLNHTIETDAILNRCGNSEKVEDREVGRKTRYNLGSVVEFEAFVLTAFTKFDDHNKACLSAEEYASFWMRFWKNIDEIHAGRTINIPLMGAGITRFKDGKPSKRELLEAMLWSMKLSGFRNTYADKQVRFIIYPADAAEIDFYHIQHNPNFK